MHVSRERRHLLSRKPCSVCFLVFYMVLWVTFSIYVLLFSSYCVYVLDMHTFLYYFASLIVCSDDHLFCYIIIVVISIWLFGVWSSCSYLFHIMFIWSHFTCYITLVILLLALPWGSNVFCANVLGYRNICFKFIISFRFRCARVLLLFPNSCLSLEFVIRCFLNQ